MNRFSPFVDGFEWLNGAFWMAIDNISKRSYSCAIVVWCVCKNNRVIWDIPVQPSCRLDRRRIVTDQVENVGIFLNDNKMMWKRQFSVEPGRLWDAIATKEGLSHWFMPTDFEVEEGGRFSFKNGWDGTVSEVEPLDHIQFDADGDSNGYLRFELEAKDDGCVFSLTDRMGEGADPKKIFGPDTPVHRIYQPGGPGTHWSGVTAGYHGFVDSLEGHVTGNKIEFDYEEMCKTYQRVLDDHFGHVG